MTTRRRFLSRLAMLAAAGGTVWLVRDRLPWPPLEPRFADGRGTPWMPLPPRSGLIEVGATVNGTPIRAVIDSGAQFSAIDAAVAERLSLPRPLAAPLLAYGVSGDPSLTHTVRLDLALPGLEVPRLRAAVLDLAAVSALTGRPFHLLIGRDVLRHMVLEADFPRDRARLLMPHAYRIPRDGMAIPLKTRAGAPTASVQIEAAAPLDLLVDTGASGWLALSESAAKQVGLLAPGRPVRRAHSVSLGGLSLNRVVEARVVRIGAVALRNVDVQIYSGAGRMPTPSGLLGTGVLRQFRMALDLGADRLHLAPPSPVIMGRPRN